MTQSLPIVSLSMLLIGLASGCVTQRPADAVSQVVFIVPGVGGSSLTTAMGSALAGSNRQIITFSWGAPPPMFFLNFSSRSVHDAAERKLAEQISQWRAEHRDGRIDLIGHSAGCGVILGALSREQATLIDRVILLAPSVSPSYDLTAAMARTKTRIDVFYSTRDTLFLDWRTSHFGTYDRIKTKAAGNGGFRPSAGSGGKLIQHPYNPDWGSLGNNGGHFGPLAAPFVKAILKPLLESPGDRPIR